ncbi:MAG: hypothetical protein AAF682_10605 [Planctomycetota bacterium]
MTAPETIETIEAIPKPEPEPRPAFFTVAVLLHVIDGFLSLVGATLGILAIAIGGVAVGVHVDGEDALIAFLGLGFAAVILALFFAFGLVRLFIAYKAWSMGRTWIWALIAVSLVATLTQPWGVLVAGVTVIGGLKALDSDAARG